jgi:hypothetical protein
MINDAIRVYFAPFEAIDLFCPLYRAVEEGPGVRAKI